MYSQTLEGSSRSLSRDVALHAAQNSHCAARRDVLLALTGCCTQVAGATMLAAITSNSASGVTVAEALGSSSTTGSTAAGQPGKDPMFYARWPYASPADIIPYIEQEAMRGDSQSVLDAMDAFSAYYP